MIYDETIENPDKHSLEYPLLQYANRLINKFFSCFRIYSIWCSYNFNIYENYFVLFSWVYHPLQEAGKGEKACTILF